MSPIIGLEGSQIALVLGVGLFVLAMVRRMRRGFGDTHQAPFLGSRARAMSVAKASLKPKEQEAWEVEMHALARRLKGEIDTKMQALTRLIQLADQARSALDTAVQHAQGAGLLDERELAVPAAERSTTKDVAIANGLSRGRRRRTELVLTPAVRGVENPSEDPRFERIYALADAGFSATKIASHTGAQVGEVELILSLRCQD